MERMWNRFPLFSGMSEASAEQAVRQMNGVVRREARGAVILREGERLTRWGMILTGKLQGQRVDEDGVLSVVSTLNRGMTFGEILIFSEISAPVTLTALTDCTLLYLQPVDPGAADPALIRNLFRLISAQYWALHEKIRYCSIVRLRRRILTYLSDHERTPGEAFDLPLDRAGMAAYLNADRSALSRELSRLKREGVLTYRKNRFRFVNVSNESMNNSSFPLVIPDKE